MEQGQGPEAEGSAATADEPEDADVAAGALEALRAVDAFSRAAPDTLQALAAQATPCQFPAGQTLMQQGERGDDVLIVARGSVDVHVRSPRRREVVLQRSLGPGTCLGEMAALFTGGVRTATVRALEPLLAYRLSAEALRAATRADPALAAGFGERIGRLEADTALKRASPFVTLPSAAIWELAGTLRRRRVGAGETVVRQGERGDGFYLVASGRMEVLDESDADEAPTRLACLGPGDCFGEAALLTDQPRNATVRALDDAELLELSRSDFQATIRAYRPVRAFFRELFFARYHRSASPLLATTDADTPGFGRRSGGVRLAALVGLGLVLLAALSVTTLRGAWPLLAWLTLLVGVLLPAGAVVGYVRQRSLLRDLPLWLLLGASALGALVGVPLAWLLQRLAASDVALVNAGLAATVEEPIKVLAVLWVMRNRHYRFGLDGAMLGVTAAMGFGTVESIGYGIMAHGTPLNVCGAGFTADGCLVQTVWLRMAALVLGHGPWTAIVCTTIWRDYGRVASARTWAVAATLLGVIVLHTLWDVDPILLGLPGAVVSLVVLRSLLRQGQRHEAAALTDLGLVSAQDGASADAPTTKCPNCGTDSPATALYCARCGLALA